MLAISTLKCIVLILNNVNTHTFVIHMATIVSRLVDNCIVILKFTMFKMCEFKTSRALAF